MIRIPQVRVIDEENAQLGVMPTAQALEMAQERGLDLVEVAPTASPPVVKFLDFGQYKYELTKREKEAKRKQRSVTFKEVRLSPKIGTGDFDTKVHRAIEFLEDGDRIKVTVRFRGRELTHPEIGRALLARFSERVKDHGVPERVPLLEGKSMHITMASLHKPKSHETPGRPPLDAPAAPAPDGAAPAAAPAATAPVAAEDEKPAAPAAKAVAPATPKPAVPTADEDEKAVAPAAAKPAAAAAPKPAAAATPKPAAPAAKAATPAAKTAAPAAATATRPAAAAVKNDADVPAEPAATGE
jgi:translation initiation factor IF-3